MGTCLADLYYPGAGLAGMQLLRREGVEVIYPKKQTCCAQPAFNSGYRKDALPVARSLMKCFTKNIPIVVPSGSCAGMIKHHWGELFVDEPDYEQAISVSNRVFELTEFLVDNLQIKLTDLGKPTKIAIHTSCSCRNELRVADRIESLASQLSNVDVLVQDRKKECCGFGGTFAIKQADISGAMVKDKTASLKATNANKVVSQDCGCLMNIGGALSKQQSKLETQHIAEFLWERTNESS
jgi:L-lactate dehydrogenase complex protein LldE|tara:strand:+ start:88 stop:804 length:717 start_codon:yes stop_codon:yes gene_type:complete